VDRVRGILVGYMYGRGTEMMMEPCCRGAASKS
jgi:hypothetical protein